MMGIPVVVPAIDASSVGEARRAAANMAGAIGLAARCASQLAIVVTEAASNIVRHAQGHGEIILRPLSSAAGFGVEVLAVDRGRGIANVVEARRDGFSTFGSPGEGLGAMARQASEFDIHSTPGQGTVVVARLWDQGADAGPDGLSVGAVCVPKPGEEMCGDSWALEADRDRVLLLVADGLGHGPQAADASRRAVEVFRQHATLPLVPLMERLHEGLRSTRGAAIGIAEMNRQRGQLGFIGLGNVSATLVAGGTRRSMVSQNGTAGVQARRFQAFDYPWPPESVLVAHSDGLASGWDLARYPGMRHGGLIAGALYRDFRRMQDDVTVVAVARRSL